MKLEKIIDKLVPFSLSPKSLENFAGKIEKFGKIGAGILALLYVAGLIVFGLYYSALNIRSIELFKVRYLFVGFYYFVFLYLHLFYPKWWTKRSWLKAGYLFVLLVFIIFLNRVNNIYFTYLIDNWFSGKSYFEFKPDHIGILNGNLIVLVTAFMFAPLIFNFSIYAGKIMKLKKGQPLFVLFILLAVALNYQVFTQFVFPYVPDAIGGGKAPIVYIVFEENIPYEVSSNFDIGGRVAGFSSPYYYGQLVYMDNDSVFLREPFWFSSDVYEIRRSDIIMLSYREYNPVEMGQPGLFP